MSERDELAKGIYERQNGNLWDQAAPVVHTSWLELADNVLAHLREKGWVSDDTVRALIRRAEQAERARDALQHTLALWDKECGNKSPRELVEELARLRTALTDIATPDIGTYAQMAGRAVALAKAALRPGGAPREGA